MTRWRLHPPGDGLALRSAGPRTGRPIVLLHGFLSDSRAWAQLGESLLGRGLRVLAPDLPGHGLSAAIRVPGGDAAWAAISVLLDRTLAPHLQKPFVLAGYSAGGRVAGWWALSGELPRRPGLTALLLESAHPGLPAAERPQRLQQDALRAESLCAAGVARFVESWERLPLFVSQTARADLEPALRRQRALRLRQSPQGLAHHLTTLGTGTMPLLTDSSLLTDLPPRPDLPAVCLTGALDPAYAALASRWVRVFPHLRLQQAAAAGHNVHLEDPSAWLRALDALLV